MPTDLSAPLDAAPRTYQLLIDVATTLDLVIGRFGCFRFPEGSYVYTGSARRNFEARIARHCSANKTLRWHIDYLLSAPGVSVGEVRRLVAPECAVNQATLGEVLIAGFGASDCRAGCRSHLKYQG